MVSDTPAVIFIDNMEEKLEEKNCGYNRKNKDNHIYIIRGVLSNVKK